MNWRQAARIAAAVSGVSFCLLELELRRESITYSEYAAAIGSSEGLLLACLALWCSTFLLITFRRNDWPLLGMLAVAIGAHLIEGLNRPSMDLCLLLFGVTLGKGTRLLLTTRNPNAITEDKHALKTVLFCLVVLLALLSLPHLDKSHAYYDLPPRWAGLWKSPNVYGALMATGIVVAVGLLAPSLGLRKIDNRESENAIGGMWRSNRWFNGGLIVATGVMAIALLFSYSRGAWLATAVGLLYLGWFYKKLKWQYVFPALAVIVAIVVCFWGHTPDSAPWYIKRADLMRPSAQHRADAWREKLEEQLAEQQFSIANALAKTVHLASGNFVITFRRSSFSRNLG